MAPELRILFLPVWYPSRFNRVAGVFVKQHALALRSSAKLAVYHICPQSSLGCLAKFERTEEEGLLTYRMYCFEFKNKLLKPLNIILYFLAGMVGYFKTINDFGLPDINHVHVLTRAGVFALFSRVYHNVPYVISEHWSRYLPERNTYHGFIRKTLTRWIVRQSQGVSAVSDGLRKAMQAKGLDHARFCLIPNTVDFDIFRPPEVRMQSKCFNFLHVSGLTDHVKNISGILNACKILKDRGVDFKFHIVGDCSKKQSLLDYATSLELNGFVIFLGELTGDDLVQQYQIADAFVLFSYFENQPCVLLEAFSSGLPVIASYAGGIPEIVNPRNGILTEMGNYYQLAENMVKLVDRPDLYNAGIIRSEAEQLFSYSAVADKLLTFYRIR